MDSCPSSFLMYGFSACPLIAWNVLSQTVPWWRLHSCASSAQMLPPPGSLLWLYQLYYIASPNSLSILLVCDHLFTALLMPESVLLISCSLSVIPIGTRAASPLGRGVSSASAHLDHVGEPLMRRWLGEEAGPTVVIREKPSVLGDFREGKGLIEEQDFFMKIQILPTDHHSVTKVWASPLVLCVLVRTGITRAFLQTWVQPACYFRVLAAAVWALLGSYFMHIHDLGPTKPSIYKGEKALKCSSAYCLPREPWVLTTCQIRSCAKKT